MRAISHSLRTSEAPQAEISAFLEAMRLDWGASENTLYSYKLDLTQFFLFLQDRSIDKPTPKSISDYLMHLSDRGCGSASINRKLSALRSFYKYCVLELGLENDPTELTVSAKREQNLPKALAPNTMAALLQAAKEGLSYPARLAPSLKARDEAMFLLLYATGLRVSELIGLKLHQMDHLQGMIRTLGKGGKERVIPFVKTAAVALEHYLSSFRSSLNPKTEHVFIGARGEPLTRQAFSKTLAHLSLQAGLDKPVSPHQIRHTFATDLLAAGINLRTLQHLLGHADLGTTQIYTQVSPPHLKRAHRKFHPRGGA